MIRAAFSVLLLAGPLALGPIIGCTTAGAENNVVTVYKTPGCECCSKWVDHLEENGFEVVTHDVGDTMPIREEAGVPEMLSSCHTGLVGGYAVEGHVPADVIQQMLQEKPEIVGLAVPGMPIGSPGMEIPGREPDSYDIIAFDKNGAETVFASR